MANTGVTESEVIEAANRLMEHGEEPTIQAIRQILKTGSLTTISRHLKKWKSAKSGKMDDEPPSAAQTRGNSDDPLDAVKMVSTQVLSDFLGHEHPQIIAAVIAHLKPEESAEVLQGLPKDLSAEVLDRTSTLSFVHPSCLKLINSILRQEFSAIAEREGFVKGGVGYVSDVLQRMKPDMRENILSGLKSQNSKLAMEMGASSAKKGVSK